MRPAVAIVVIFLAVFLASGAEAIPWPEGTGEDPEDPVSATINASFYRPVCSGVLSVDEFLQNVWGKENGNYPGQTAAVLPAHDAACGIDRPTYRLVFVGFGVISDVFYSAWNPAMCLLDYAQGDFLTESELPLMCAEQ